MGASWGGGSIAPLRMSVHNKKPDVIVLTETRLENEIFEGKKKVFRGYEAFQHSSSGRRSGGVMVLTKRGFNPMYTGHN